MSAIRRCGELLKTYDGRGRPSENNAGTHGISQRQAAADAGMSEHQQLQAVRVANIPADDFEPEPDEPSLGWTRTMAHGSTLDLEEKEVAP